MALFSRDPFDVLVHRMHAKGIIINLEIRRLTFMSLSFLSVFQRIGRDCKQRRVQYSMSASVSLTGSPDWVNGVRGTADGTGSCLAGWTQRTAGTESGSRKPCPRLPRSNLDGSPRDALEVTESLAPTSIKEERGDLSSQLKLSLHSLSKGEGEWCLEIDDLSELVSKE